MNDLSNYRKSYEKSELLESNIPRPINLFNTWFHEAEEFGGNEEVNAMTVATVGLDGFPKSRVVLLKNLLRKVIFYTNYNSDKGKAIANNPKYVFLFFGTLWNDRL
jgi:pyridoxamine 5'-phosphate oxidase